MYCHKGKYRTLKTLTSKNRGRRAWCPPPRSAPAGNRYYFKTRNGLFRKNKVAVLFFRTGTFPTSNMKRPHYLNTLKYGNIQISNFNYVLYL